MEKTFRIIRVIDALSDWSGRMTSWLVFPLVGGLGYEVFARYCFKAPTIWAYDVTYMLYGGVFMLGAAYTLYKKGHIRTDMLYHKFPVRWQGIVDASMYLFFFFPGMLLFLIIGGDYAYESWVMKERASISPWRPPIYPFKTVIPLTALLLLIQGASEFIKSLYAARKGEWP
ncbi:MAG: TRAP transporter small permease subunit [Syntrophaceae bacterium]|nr:TRAP transporter small permease subunit [Syntrophaceae bacterium]